MPIDENCIQKKTWLNHSLGIITIFIIIGVFWVKPAFYPHKPTPNTKTPNVQSVFNTQWNNIPTPMTLFYSQVFLNREKTKISIPIKFTNEIEEAWLHVDSSSTNVPWKWLISHPKLIGLNWPSINKGSIYLYQRNPVYSSIDDFIKAPPEKNKIAIDDMANQLTPYRKLYAYPLTKELDLDSIDYVLTTYHHSEQENLSLYYVNTVDTSSGVVDTNNNLTWKISVANTTAENPYYVGEIHIDYLQ